jgi:hypothetical protein
LDIYNGSSDLHVLKIYFSIDDIVPSIY